MRTRGADAFGEVDAEADGGVVDGAAGARVADGAGS